MATAPAAVIDHPAHRRRGQVYVALAAVAWSTAGVAQRQLSVDVATQLAGRAAFATLALMVFVALGERGRVISAWRAIGIAGVGVALCLAVASAGFIAALNHTTVARVLFIQAIAPVLAGLFAWLLLGEPVGARTALAMAIAFAGVG
jgi:drug/metabolite transporter (DMT)-like permease